MPFTTTINRPPVPGTATEVWEGYVRADELLIGDVVPMVGRVEGIVRDLWADQIVVKMGGRVQGRYNSDEEFFIERTVTVTITAG